MSLIDKLFGSFSDKELKRIRPIADETRRNKTSIVFVQYGMAFGMHHFQPW